MKLDKEKLFSAIMLAIIFSLFIFQLTKDIGKEQIKLWDESSSAQNAVEMMQYKNYLVVHRDGEPLLHEDTKPPLNLWLKVVSFKIFGINEFAVRFPSVMAVIGTVLMLLFFSIRYIKNRWIALIIAILVPSTSGFMTQHVARTGEPDALLILFVTGYFLSFFILLHDYPKNRGKWYFFTGLSVVLAAYAKSVAGFVPLAGLGLYALFHRNFYKILLDYRFHLTWILTLATIAAYYIINEKLNPGYIENSILREISFTGSKVGNPKHPESSYYFDYLTQKGFTPFIYMLIISILLIFTKIQKKYKQIILYSLSAAFVLVFANSLSVTKNQWYIAPVYPFLWLIFGVTFVAFLKLFRNKKGIFFTLSIIFSSALLYFSAYKYLEIYDKNQSFLSYIDECEREGDFIDSLPILQPEMKHFVVLSTNNPRAIKFYTKKLKYYETEYEFEIHKYCSDKCDLVGKNLITAEKYYKNKIEFFYNYDIVEKGKYCNLYTLKNKANIILKKQFKSDLEGILDSLTTKLVVAKEDSTVTFVSEFICDTLGYKSKMSLILNEQNKFGFTNEYFVNSYKYLHVKCWVHGAKKPYIVINCLEKDFYLQDLHISDKDGEWIQIENFVKIPNELDQNNIKIYLWNTHPDTLHVDDFEVEFY